MTGKDDWKDAWAARYGRIELERFRIGTVIPAWAGLADESLRLSDGLAASVGYSSFSHLQQRCADGHPFTDEERQGFLWFLAEREKVVKAIGEKGTRLSAWVQAEEDKIRRSLVERLDRAADTRLSGAQYKPDKGQYGSIGCRIDGTKQKDMPLLTAQDAATARKDAFSVAVRYFADRLMYEPGTRPSRGRSV